jgi:hypothetical protein
MKFIVTRKRAQKETQQNFALFAWYGIETYNLLLAKLLSWEGC